MDVSQILGNLFVGSCPKTADDVTTLRDQGVTAVVNLQSDEDFEYHGIDWSALRAAYFALRIDARRVPITDFDDNDLRERLVDAVRVLGKFRQFLHSVHRARVPIRRPGYGPRVCHGSKRACRSSQRTRSATRWDTPKPRINLILVVAKPDSRSQLE